MDLILSKPKFVNTLADSFKNSQGSYANVSHAELSQLMMLFLFSHLSFSSLARQYPKSMSVSSLSRAARNLRTEFILQRMQAQLLKAIESPDYNPKHWVWCVDDTDNRKYGRNVYGNIKLYKSGKGTYKGQRLIVLCLINIKTGMCYPVDYQFCTNKDDPEHIPGMDRVLNMLDLAFEKGFPVRRLVADSWFAGNEFQKQLQKRKMIYVLEPKSSWLFKNNTEPKEAKNRPLTELSKETAKVQSRIVQYENSPRLKKVRHFDYKIFVGKFKSISFQQKVLAMFNSPKAFYGRTKEAWGFCMTNDLNMSAEEMYELNRARWCIEVMFRDLKQNLSFGKLSLEGKEGAHMAVCLPFAIYTAALKEIKATEGSHCTVGSLLKKIRNKQQTETIDKLVEGKHLREKLGKDPLVKVIKSRRHISKINQKPVNTVSERIKIQERIGA